MFRENVLVNAKIINRVSETMIPVALDYQKVLDRQTRESRFLLPLMKQRNQEQGLWIFSPEGKSLGGFEGFGDMVGQMKRVIEGALKTFGPVAPRRVVKLQTHPYRGKGFRTNGSVCLAEYVRRREQSSWSSGGHERYPGASAAQEAGIPFMILGAALQEDAERAMNAFQRHVMFMAEDPCWSGLCGVQLADEPRNPINQANHRLQRDWLVQTYPRLLTLICEVLTDYPTCEKQYDTIRPDAFIYQWYPYHTSDTDSLDISPYMYACLGRASKFCQERGIGFFIARGATGPPKSDSLLRINTYAALAYGCKGFIDFSWDSSDRYKQMQLTPDPPDWGYVSYQKGKPRPTPHLEKLARINREVANIGATLLDLRHIRTYHLELRVTERDSNIILTT